jgi:beta-lactamase regulating signal transducer with metallopeptidase domain
MQEFYQSNLLQSLGWAITDSLWQMSLLWLIYQLVITPVCKNKPSVRHLAAVSALFAGALWFFISFYQRLNSVDTLATTVAHPVPQAITLTRYLVSLLPYFSFAYLTVLVLLLVRLAYNVVSTQRLRVELIPTVEWQHVVNRLTVQMGISRDIFIYLSEQINVPSTIGCLKPIILLPIASMNHLSIEQLEAVIMHEMAHIRRNDYIINLLVAFVETILFFNPFAHLLAKAIRKECEMSCDDHVLNQQLDPREYAQALLLLEKARLKPILALAATGKQGLLLGRVKRILNMPDQDLKYRNKLAALAAVAGLVMLTGLLAPTKTSSADDQKKLMAQAKTNGSGEPLFKAQTAPGLREIITSEKKVLQKQVRTKLHMMLTAPPTAHPATPPTPPVPQPPVHPAGEESLQQVWVFPDAASPHPADVPVSATAPDPRDRRHPDILRNADRNQAMNPELMDKVFEGIDLEQMIAMEKKKTLMPGAYFDLIEVAPEVEKKKRVYFNRIENAPNLDVEKIILGHTFETSPGSKGKKPRPENIKGMAVTPGPNGQNFDNEKEMTIRIIREESQIEITLKERK